MLRNQQLKTKSIANHFYSEEMVQNASIPLTIRNKPTTITICGKHEGHIIKYYDDEQNIQKLFKDYLEEKAKTVSQKTCTITRSYLKSFIDYLDSNKLNIQSLRHTHLKTYSQYLIQIRLSKNKTLKPSYIKAHFKYVNYFINWLVTKEQLKNNIFNSQGLETFTEEVIKEFDQQRQNHLKKNISIEQILSEYQELLKTRHPGTQQQILSQLKKLKHYFELDQKSLLELKEDDFEKIKDIWNNDKNYKLDQKSINTTVNHLIYIKQFYTWLYLKGTIEKDYLKTWTSPKLKQELEQKREEQAKQKTKKRIPHKHLLKHYQNYLDQQNFNDDVINNRKKDVHFFCQYLIQHQKTLTTFKKTQIDQFKHYLLNYEHQPGKTYSAEVQTRIMRSLRRFYNWAVFKRQLEHNPFGDMNIQAYNKWLQHNRKPDLPYINPDKWYDNILSEFTHYQNYKGLTKKVIETHLKGCRYFFDYLEDVGITQIEDIDKRLIRNFTHYLKESLNNKGEPLSVSTQIRHIAGLVNFFRYLEQYDLISKVISSAFTYPKNPYGLPTPNLNRKEFEEIINTIPGTTSSSIRDRAILELLFTSGIRSNELVNLKISNIYFETGTIRVDVPKGGKQYERVIPIGLEAEHWLKQYLEKVRSTLPRNEHLFVKSNGQIYTIGAVLAMIKKHKKKTSLKKKRIVTHSFRVSCATEMLKNGANVKIVQEQLGHRQITSTEKYLRLVPGDLKKAHRKYHPRG